KLAFFPTQRRDYALWIPEHSYAGELGNSVLEQLQPFTRQFRGNVGLAGDVAAGSRKAISESATDRVSYRCHNDRDCRGSVFGSQGIWSNGSNDHVNLETHQLGCERGEPIVFTFRISVFNADVFSFNPSELAQSLAKCLVPDCAI